MDPWDHMSYKSTLFEIEMIPKGRCDGRGERNHWATWGREVEVNESEKLPDNKDNKQWELVEKMARQVDMDEAFENEK